MSDWTGTGTVAEVPPGYCARADIEQVFGKDNVTKWADLDGDSNLGRIAARILVAIEAAQDEVDNTLRDGMYVIPLTSVPVTVRDITATLAGVWLFTRHGEEDAAEGEPAHRLEGLRNNVRRQLTQIRTGGIRLDAILKEGVTWPAPQVTT